MTEIRKATTMAWRKLLSSEEGQEGMLFLRERIPSINKGPADEMIFEGGRVEGYKMALNMISEVLVLAKPKDEKLENE